MTLELHIILR